MAKIEGSGGGGGVILSQILRPIVARRLELVTERIAPLTFSHFIHSDLTAEELVEIGKVQDLFLESVLADQIKRQTRPRSLRSLADKAGDLFPDSMLEDWISADPSVDEGEDDVGMVRIKIRHAVWADHIAYRENQIRNIRAANLGFEVWEERRDTFSRVGMSSRPEMTTETAMTIIKGR